MASIKDDGMVEAGLLAYKDKDTSKSTCSFDSESTQRPVIELPQRRRDIIYTLCCVTAGIAISLVVLSISASLKMTHMKPASSTASTGIDRVDYYSGWNLNLPLVGDVDPVENDGHCGSSPAEARARGCKFDLVLYSWVPTPCYDQEIQTAYRERESEWWRERGGVGGEKISQERAALGVEESMWLSWDYHDYHCHFIWRMMTRILRNTSMGIPGRLLEYHHTEHCIEVLKGIDPGPKEDISTRVSLNYSTCYSRI